MVHCKGEKLIADMLTKALSSGRLRMLLTLWGMETEQDDLEAEAESILAPAVSSQQRGNPKYPTDS